MYYTLRTILQLLAYYYLFCHDKHQDVGRDQFYGTRRDFPVTCRLAITALLRRTQKLLLLPYPWWHINTLTPSEEPCEKFNGQSKQKQNNINTTRVDGHSREGRGIMPVSGDRFAKWNFDEQTQNIRKHATLTYSFFFFLISRPSVWEK